MGERKASADQPFRWECGELYQARHCVQTDSSHGSVTRGPSMSGECSKAQQSRSVRRGDISDNVQRGWMNQQIHFCSPPAFCTTTIIACSHRWQNCLVVSCLCWRCKHNYRQDKTRQFCPVSTQFPICNCSVSNISRTTENLEIGNWVKTRQNCLVLSAVVFTPPTRTRQDSLVLSLLAVWTSHNIASTAIVRNREWHCKLFCPHFHPIPAISDPICISKVLSLSPSPRRAQIYVPVCSWQIAKVVCTLQSLKVIKRYNHYAT